MKLPTAFLPIIFFCFVSIVQAASIPATGVIEAFFSPNGGCTDAIVREICNAKSEVLIQAYSFTSVPIAKAIVQAKKRGVKIEAVLDKSQRTGKYSAATFLVNAGIPVLIDDQHAIAHNKIIIIDRNTLITGSFNFSKAAEEKNAENLLVFKGNTPLVLQYIQNFDHHKRHSEPYNR
ncbi:endonuclease Nuc [Geotalea daltonii FRC-32]|uniref:phospholipase D n=1 Tax=Geotalea daltonii (strain DSM 22248 / JCM 15807 / FRC-32) TaxID=316067 RepID=B9M102_GEODF|nr:phospholipase D family protein [Geotalea daltonii]ACM19072.1 endonuclease Nuc [Geotalea daltonii FRC-32]